MEIHDVMNKGCNNYFYHYDIVIMVDLNFFKQRFWYGIEKQKANGIAVISKTYQRMYVNFSLGIHFSIGVVSYFGTHFV